MWKKLDFIAALIIVLLGTAHTALTPLLAKQFNSAPTDFAAIGLAFVFLGLINISRIATNEKITNILCFISNLFGLSWLCFGFIYEKSFVIQGSVPFVIICFLLIQSVINMRKHIKKS